MGKSLNPLNDFGKRLNGVLMEAGKNQRWLAKVSGVPYTTISRAKRAKGLPDTSTLRALATALRTTVDHLSGGIKSDTEKSPLARDYIPGPLPIATSADTTGIALAAKLEPSQVMGEELVRGIPPMFDTLHKRKLGMAVALMTDDQARGWLEEVLRRGLQPGGGKPTPTRSRGHRGK